MIIIQQQARAIKKEKDIDPVLEAIKNLNSQFKIDGSKIDGIEDMDFKQKEFEGNIIVSRKLYLISEEELSLLKSNADKL